MPSDQAGTAGKPKVVILGGGIAGLVTAYGLTEDPAWRDRFESVTVHQIGWRLGGKCASSRGPHGRIQEHGIHGFLGSYWNALPLFAEIYAELGRPSGAPLASFEDAFRRDDFGILWEAVDSRPVAWRQRFPSNDLKPQSREAAAPAFARAMAGLVRGLGDAALEIDTASGALTAALKTRLRSLIERLAATLAQDLQDGAAHPAVTLVADLWRPLRDLLFPLASGLAPLRRSLIVVDFILTLIKGALDDDVPTRGYDHLDAETYSDWLARHGARPETIASPMALNYINMTYQYPDGDTSRPPCMAAGVYVHWALHAFAYIGDFIWRFAAGSGETLIAPLYEVLRRRGVRFEFFHKVEGLRLTPDGRSVAAVELAVQATLKPGHAVYEPLIAVKGLPSWPEAPLADQLVEGEALERLKPDLESWWTPWPAAGRLILNSGEDFDHLVFALSIGAVPHLCQELIAADPRWGAMVEALPAHLTQAMQIWVDKSVHELGWRGALKPGESVLSTTFLNPFNGHGEFADLIPLEDWPDTAAPRGLWYFCGLMTADEPEPPFTDHDYPRRQAARVKAQAIQYLQAAMGALVDKATTQSWSPPGDPFGFDFDRLVAPETPDARGMARFDSQFWRANIDPTERYVTSPPGSTAARLKAWDSGFSNLSLAGDWIYTGLNIGSVEGTVMSGLLASHAVCGSPPLERIAGYPSEAHPAGV
ncbi:MAG: NAD(P)-binding protein [Alphaproteobacteria bacterium]|nr:NAD(P)-binding protein [Alphaproteobacteria bacterium]